MPYKNFKDESRKNWSRHVTTENDEINNSEIQLGAILRIADATEKMAQRYTDLLSRNEYLDSYVKRLEASSRTKDRQINALRGHITRIKKKTK